MKKILVFTTLLLTFAGSVFAVGRTPNTLGSHTLSPSGAAIYAGQSAQNAADATSPQIKLSNKVIGIVNFDTATQTTGTSLSYAIGTKHDGGSKIFGTSDISTNIYFKIVPAVPWTDAALFGIATDGTNFTSAASWTSY